MRWFNDKVLEKNDKLFKSYKRKKIYRLKAMIIMRFFYELNKNKETFTYLDPPYMLTTGAYNDGKRGFHGWNTDTEKKFF